MDREEDPEKKEDFCSTCVAGLAALAGLAGAGTSGSVSTQRRTKSIIFWVSIGVTVISIAVLIYLLYFQEQCGVCTR